MILVTPLNLQLESDQAARKKSASVIWALCIRRTRSKEEEYAKGIDGICVYKRSVHTNVSRD